MSFCDYCTDWFIAQLERDIAAHEAGRVGEVGEAFDDMPEWNLCDDEKAQQRLAIAYDFWDEWIDDRNHGWCIYNRAREDWPIRARQIVRGLREGWEPEEMMGKFPFNSP